MKSRRRMEYKSSRVRGLNFVRWDPKPQTKKLGEKTTKMSVSQVIELYEQGLSSSAERLVEWNPTTLRVVSHSPPPPHIQLGISYLG